MAEAFKPGPADILAKRMSMLSDGVDRLSVLVRYLTLTSRRPEGTLPGQDDRAVPNGQAPDSQRHSTRPDLVASHGSSVPGREARRPRRTTERHLGRNLSG